MVVIRCNAPLDGADMARLIKEIRAQEETGVIVLPPWCELLSEVPTGEGIQIVQQKEDARVAELEKELAAEKEKSRRMCEKLCSACRNQNAPAHQSECWACTNGGLFSPQR